MELLHAAEIKISTDTKDLGCYAWGISLICHQPSYSGFIWCLKRSVKEMCPTISQQLMLTTCGFSAI